MQVSKSVKDPGKQRERLFNTPAHARHKLMSAHLAPDLVKSHGIKALPVRKGDTVRIMRGDHQGFEGKISTVDLKNYRILLEGLTREKVDGTIIFVSVHPSKVLIKTLNLDDKWRKATIERKKQLVKEEAVEEKPAVKETLKPKEEKVKPVKAKPKPARARTKAKAKVKEEKPIEEEIKPAVEEAKPTEAKAEKPEAVVEKEAEAAKEKPTAKKPRAVKKAVERTAAAEKKPETVVKEEIKAPARKRKEAKAQVPMEEPAEEAETAEPSKPTLKGAAASTKKTAPKKVAGKRKTKVENETEGT